ncbi:unnamed protein product, partial [Urochloa humidicola]
DWTGLQHIAYPDKVRHGNACRAHRTEASKPTVLPPPMETTASWRLLSPASSSPPATPQLPKRQPTFAGSTKLSPILVFAFFYFLVCPPLIMNWMRVRWYKRKFVETYLQFMITYIFYPALMFWAPFVNFRKFPRDPTMKYPWSKPKEGTPLFKDRYPPIDSI